uniref:Uncharacterized protein n=1 Tax=Rhizophora mucronata TaxID=61149 RepID=A0A2P2Q210_RHIMU
MTKKIYINLTTETRSS